MHPPSAQTHPLNPLERWAPADGLSAFEAWSESGQGAGKMTEGSKAHYRWIWESWLRFLSELGNDEIGPADGRRYLRGTGALILRFLDQGAEPSTARRATQSITAVSRYRYALFLWGVYGYFESQGWIPARAILRSDLPGSPTEIEKGGQVLPPQVWARMPLVLEEFIEQQEAACRASVDLSAAAVGDARAPGGAAGRAAALARARARSLLDVTQRNRAMVLTMMETGLRSQEVRELRRHQIDLSSGREHVRLDDGKKARLVPIVSKACQAALSDWMQRLPPDADGSSLVFASRKSGSLTKRAVFHAVAQAVTRACELSGEPVPMHIGPNALRNTTMMNWVQAGLSAGEVCDLAGLKDEASLRRLRRIMDGRVIARRNHGTLEPHSPH